MASKTGKNQRKFGRNKDYCNAYTASGKQVLSHARRALKHIQRYGATDAMAVHYYNNLPELVKKQLGVRSVTLEPTKAQRKKPAYWGAAMGGHEALARDIMSRRNTPQG